MNNLQERGAGILCHISSLPNKYGIGSLGKEAYAFADFLRKAHVKYWQILPLTQTDCGDSPYSSVSCNSYNPYFIDLEALYEEGLIDEEELASCILPSGDVDYAAVAETHYKVLRLAYRRYDVENDEFKEFISSCVADNYALFMSLKSVYPVSFDKFPEEYKYRDAQALEKFRQSVYKTEYLFWVFLQFTFIKQWKKLKAYVNSLGIKIIGDIPLYCAYDSCDVWANGRLFRLDSELRPEAVAGVPPDYFSKTGQLWGNPLYDWDELEKENYEWWIARIRNAAELYDVIRIDHFRGLDRYYAIPADAETAETGEWVDGPKQKLFAEVKKRLGEIQVIAEDLGVMDEGVEQLRAATGYPGMKIVLFAFDGKDDNAYLPSNMEEDCVAYTGTHDNATCLGLLNRMTDEQFKVFKKRLRAELKKEEVVLPLYTREEAARALGVCTLASPAKLAILPVQDVLILGDEARMNIPATPEGNWRFRLKQIPSRYYAAVLRKVITECGR